MLGPHPSARSARCAREERGEEGRGGEGEARWTTAMPGPAASAQTAVELNSGCVMFLLADLCSVVRLCCLRAKSPYYSVISCSLRAYFCVKRDSRSLPNNTRGVHELLFIARDATVRLAADTPA